MNKETIKTLIEIAVACFAAGFGIWFLKTGIVWHLAIVIIAIGVLAIVMRSNGVDEGTSSANSTQPQSGGSEDTAPHSKESAGYATD